MRCQRKKQTTLGYNDRPPNRANFRAAKRLHNVRLNVRLSCKQVFSEIEAASMRDSAPTIEHEPPPDAGPPDPVTVTSTIGVPVSLLATCIEVFVCHRILGTASLPIEHAATSAIGAQLIANQPLV